MDDAELKDLLKNIDTPNNDESKQKSDVQAALDAFRQEKQKKSQGLILFPRLMGKTNSKQRENSMTTPKSKKKLYAGSALVAASLCILATPIVLDQMGGATGETSAGIANVQVDAIAFDDTRTTPSTSEPADYVMAENYAAPKKEATMSRQLMASAPEADAMYLGQALDDEIAPDYYKDEGRDKFEDFEVNPIKIVNEEPVSTFSSDVDTASYSFVRRQLNNGVLPQKDAVRIEEMINYFDYNYPLPDTMDQPFKPIVTLTDSPWNSGKQLMHIGIKGYDIIDAKPKSNLVFLLDTSGSMNSPDKLPLLKSSLNMLLDNMSDEDTISIVTYASGTRVALEPTPASEKSKIMSVLNNLQAGGGTNGASGINEAYSLAEQNFDEDAVNRVILATDGDFNVGITNREELQDYIERKRDKGIYLSVLGFGQGNYNDHMMQTLAQNGNGVAAYIDNLNEARKVLVEEANSTLFPIAKDVKIQVEFNPKTVAEYRLIGYETRALKREDFNNDKVDAGDIGAGHSVTAIYEITPTDSNKRSVSPLRYGNKEQTSVDTDAFSGEYAFLKMRYKRPDENTSNLITTPVTDANWASLEAIECGEDQDCIQSASDDVRFGLAVAGFGQILKGGKYTADFDYDDVIELATDGKGSDEFGYRSEFIQLVRMAKSLD